MKRSSAPNISAPLSRSGTRHKSSRNLVCVAATILILILISLGGSLLFIAQSTTNNEGSQQLSQLRRRQEGQLDDSISEEKRDPTNTQGLLIRTDQIGDIQISFRPDLSGPSSIQYIIDVVQAAAVASNTESNNDNHGVACARCKFYRAETNLLLQGVLAQNTISSKTVSLGPCPQDAANSELHCPEHDPNCGCHGPIMTKGMVGWAGGGEGPDFFINTFEKPVDWWEHQHTVWGELDEESIRAVESSYELPAHKQGMRMLDAPIKFTIELF